MEWQPTLDFRGPTRLLVRPHRAAAGTAPELRR
jgi:hypothetical protein